MSWSLPSWAMSVCTLYERGSYAQFFGRLSPGESWGLPSWAMSVCTLCEKGSYAQCLPSSWLPVVAIVGITNRRHRVCRYRHRMSLPPLSLNVVVVILIIVVAIVLTACHCHRRHCHPRHFRYRHRISWPSVSLLAFLLPLSSWHVVFIIIVVASIITAIVVVACR